MAINTADSPVFQITSVSGASGCGKENHPMALLHEGGQRFFYQ